MRYRTLIPGFIVAFIVQLSVLSLFSINGIVPSLLLCLLLISILLFGEEQRAIGCGLIAGLLLDLAVGKVIGVYALVFFVEGLFAYFYKQYFNFESRISIIPLGIVGTLIYHGLSCMILAFCGVQIAFFKVLMVFLVTTIMNLIVMFIMYVLMIRKATARPLRSRYERYQIR